MGLSKKDLKLFDSKRGLKYLLSSDPPDFERALSRILFENQILELQAHFVKLQDDILETGQRLIILFEGRDFAGKGSAIRLMTEHLNPRSIRQIALPKPNVQEEGQWYLQRYIRLLPQPGEIVFFDRSWYNRAIVEPVNGFCTKREYARFMENVVPFEEMLVKDGIQLFKFYLKISKKEQQKRIELVKKNPLSRWQFSQVDKRAQELWTTTSRYEKSMFEKTHSKECPWVLVDANNKEKAYPECLKYVLNAIKKPGKSGKHFKVDKNILSHCTP